MDKGEMSRRKFLGAAGVGAMAVVYEGKVGMSANITKNASKPAILGGKAVRTKSFQSWPIWDPGAEEHVLSILRSGNWFRGRGNTVTQFEKAYAELMFMPDIIGAYQEIQANFMLPS